MKDHDFKNAPDLGKAVAGAFENKPIKSLTIDAERYQHMLDDSGMSEAEKAEFLEALWSIVVAFVELGYGIHPAQEVCGQDEDLFPLPDNEDSDGVESKERSSTTHERGAPDT